MNNKLYYWAENLKHYSADNKEDYDQIIEIKRLNFFIGKNNAGKSRFLRSLYISTPNIEHYNFYDTFPDLNMLKELVNTKNQDILMNKEYNSTNRKSLIKSIDLITQTPKYPPNKYKESFLSFIREIKKYSFNGSRALTELIFKIENNINASRSKIIIETNKIYIPVLRGMRPVTDIDTTQPYIYRAQKDYFKDREKFNSKNIITGETLYEELKRHLLGEPEQRELIKSYEEKLSQYFFDNETVTLIPKFGKDETGNENDVVHIKIGHDAQFPIYNLGDGLQQVIILTFEAFTKNKAIYAFFIEEPELHMHAGMVRQLMNFYLNETNHYYFFTTHSNHLLDMVDESDQVIIQKFVKEQNQDDPFKFDFKIYRCDRDHELLTSLGVRPSSVYLSNCTIWVEGVTEALLHKPICKGFFSDIIFK